MKYIFKSLIFFTFLIFLVNNGYAKKLTAYPDATDGKDTDIHIVSQDGVTKNVTTGQILEDLVAGDIEFTQTGVGATTSDMDTKSKQIKSVDDYDTFAEAVTAQGATPTVLYGSNSNKTIASGTTVTMPSTITYVPRAGVVDGIAGGGTETLTINGGFLADPSQQIFGSNLIVTGLTETYPEHFGAVGDGVTDEAAVFTKCVAAIASKGSIILNKESTYQLDTTVAIGAKHISIVGGGTVNLGADDYAFSVDGGIIEIERIAFTTDSAGTGHVAEALSESRGVFKNNTVTNLLGGFSFYWNDSIFDGNIITLSPASAVGGYGIHIPGSGNKVVNNTITGGRHAIYVSGGPETPTDPVEDNLVSGNTCTGQGLGAIALAAQPTQGAARENRIIENIIVDNIAGPGIDINTNVYNNTISNNTIYGFVGGHGISIEGIALTTAGQRPYNNMVNGNIIIGKVVDETTYFNIKVLNGFLNTISNNTLIQPITTTSASASGIFLDSQTSPNAYGNVVRGNDFFFCRLLNASIDGTQVNGNTFNLATTQVPITIAVTGDASVGRNILGPNSLTSFTDGDTTPSVAKGYVFKTVNTGATSITDFDDGYIGQVIIVVFTDADTTLLDLTAGGQFNLWDSADFNYSASDAATFVKHQSNLWREVSRGDNL